MYSILNDYVTAKIAAAAARKTANNAIAAEGVHTLPEACDKTEIHKAFVSLARANKGAKAVVDGIDGAALFVKAEAQRAEKRALKLQARHEALENAINSRIDEILADDKRRALLIAEAQAASELAAQAAPAGEVEATA